MKILEKMVISVIIDKINLLNFKQFKEVSIEFNLEKNILIGENNVGKTSILLAINYVLTGSYSEIEKAGLESLFNSDVISNFMAGSRAYNKLPKMEVELFINDDIQNFELNGKHNSDKKELNGLKMIAYPNNDFSPEIHSSLKDSSVFPFEYYKLEFRTFADRQYHSYNRYKNHLKSTLLDGTKVNSAYARKSFINKIYLRQAQPNIRQKINHAYRQSSHAFSETLRTEFHLESSPDQFTIVLDSQGENSFQESITAKRNGIDIKNMGQGETIFMNTDFALSNSPEDIKVVLLEEPENHLSYVNMHMLIDKIKSTQTKQTFITTHSNMISSRLDLKNAIFIKNATPLKLDKLSQETSSFFQKAPDTNILNFILASKVILVEGDAEFILLDSLYENAYKKNMYLNNITLIACKGKTFKRYLDLAKILNIQVAVITDNDKDYAENITKNYSDYHSDLIRIFAPEQKKLSTFEIVLYADNTVFLDTHLKTAHMKNGLQEYMLGNKAESSLRILKILDSNPSLFEEFHTPQYIRDAFEWIN